MNQVALEKVYNFATSNIFETRVAGRMVADMCRAAAKVGELANLNISAIIVIGQTAADVELGLSFTVSPCRVPQTVCATLLQCHPSLNCQYVP